MTVAVAGVKACTKCLQEKPLEEFSPNGKDARGDGRRGACKTCERARHARARAARRAGQREQRHAETKADKKRRKFGRYAGRPSQGHRAITWIELNCVFTKGRFKGKPFRLLHWQKRLLYRLLVQVEDPNQPGALIREVRKALVGVAKKNGKTELVAALALWFLIDDDSPEVPEIVCAAAGDDQADLVFGAASTMCEESPSLRAVTKVWSDQVTIPARPGAYLERVAVGGGNLDGKNLALVIIDELHEWVNQRHRETYRVLTNGTIAHSSPLILQITTAGFDQESLCFTEYEYGQAVIAGEVDDPTYYFEWHAAPDDCELDDEAAWRQANPSWEAGLVLFTRYLEDLGKKPPNEARRYNLNQWTESDVAWLPPGAWGNCEGPVKFDPTLPSVLTWDASTKYDSTAISHMQQQGDGDDQITVVETWIWERPLLVGGGGQLDPDWKIPRTEIKNHVRQMVREFPKLEVIGYDPTFITWTVEDLEDEGLPMEEVPQYGRAMVLGSQALYESIVNVRLRQNGDRRLARHIAAAVSKQADGGGWRLAKGRARKVMDAAICLAMGFYLLSREPEKPVPRPQLY